MKKARRKAAARRKANIAAAAQRLQGGALAKPDDFQGGSEQPETPTYVWSHGGDGLLRERQAKRRSKR